MTPKQRLQGILIDRDVSDFMVAGDVASIAGVSISEDTDAGKIRVTIGGRPLDEYPSPGPAKNKYDTIIAAWAAGADARLDKLIEQAILELGGD